MVRIHLGPPVVDDRKAQSATIDSVRPASSPRPSTGAHSSAGRAAALHAAGRAFEPPCVHHEVRSAWSAFGASGCDNRRVLSAWSAFSRWRQTAIQVLEGPLVLPGGGGSGPSRVDTPSKLCLENCRWEERSRTGCVTRQRLTRCRLTRPENERSREGRMVDALGQRADEGRGQRRNATGSCKQAMIRGNPNGETRPPLWGVTPAESIV